MNTYRTLTAIILLFLIASQPGFADLIRNGSFEESVQPDAIGFKVILAGSKDITAWEVTGHSVDLDGPYWEASNGAKSIDLNGIDAGGIKQAFATEIGRVYQVTFDLAGNPFGPTPTKTLEISAAGQVQQFTFDVSGKTAMAMGWEQRAFVFTATQSSTTLEFKSLVTGPHGPALDNVSVTVVEDTEKPVLGLRSNRVLELRAPSDFARIPDSDSLDVTTDFTIEAWVYSTNPMANDQAVVAKRRPDGGTMFALRVTQGRAGLGLNDNRINFVSASASSQDIQPNRWHHLAATYDGQAAKVYIDGVLKASGNAQLQFRPSTFPVTIGREDLPGDPRPFVGQIDSVRIWSTVLSLQAIRTNMWHKLKGGEPKLAGLWEFDDATVNDQSTFANHGQLVGQARIVEGFAAFPKPALLTGRFSFVLGYRFTLDGETNASYQVESSTDLLQWTPLMTVKVASSPLVFTDPSATNFPGHRFYRARQVP